MSLGNILKGTGGQLEWTRVFGAVGVAIYIVFAHVFEGWTVFWQGKPFDITAYCLAFPSGLAVAIGGIATAAAQKDKAVAVAAATTSAAATAADQGIVPGVKA